jgi:hypothetical protein
MLTGERREMHTNFFAGIPRQKKREIGRSILMRKLLKRMLNEYGVRKWIRFIWLKVEAMY